MGVSPNPNFLSKLTKTKFALVNGQKCDETHNVTNTVEPSIGKPRSSVVHKFIHQDIAIDNGE